MGLLSERDLEEMKRINAQAMDATAEALIERQPAIGTKVPGGGTTTAYVPVSSGRPCRLRPAKRGSEDMLGGQLVGSNLWVIEFLAGEDVGERDRVTVTGQTGAVVWSRMFEVVSVAGPMSDEVHRAALVKLPGAR